MKLHIQSKLKENAWGGGNQFLKALQSQLQSRGVYTDSSTTADAIIFNSYQDIGALLRSFFLYHKSICVYRLGPIFSLHRKGVKWKLVDYAVAMVANIFADVVIFQSQWSLGQSRRFGFMKKNNVHVILNAVDSTLFYPAEGRALSEKIRLIYTSWSNSENKGFPYLRFLDKNLDWKKYHMIFIGNTPETFKNIEMKSPLPSLVLADELRSADIFISPTKDDACSNAILEALSCGLPVVALDSGGNAELIEKGGILFSNEEEMVYAIDTVSADIESFKRRIDIKSIADIADEYLTAIRGSIT